MKALIFKQTTILHCIQGRLSGMCRIVVFLFGTLIASVIFGGIDGSSNDSDYLNKEYSPSLWSKRYFNGVDVVGVHVSFVAKESEIVRQLFGYETIAYGDNQNEKYDIYGMGLPSDAPIFVYIHGGYWQMLNKNVSAYCVEPLLAAGIKVIVLGYDLCPTVTLTELVEQVTKFGEFFLNKPDYVKSKRIIFAGHSAGAHLVLCIIDKLFTKKTVSTEHLRIDSVHLISGIYDLSELQHTNNNENNILSINNSNVNQLSPLKFDLTEWQKHHIDINIYVGQYESPTFIRQSIELYIRFSTDNTNVKFQLLSEYDHFEIVEHLSRASYEITKRIIDSSGCVANTSAGTLIVLSIMLLFTIAV